MSDLCERLLKPDFWTAWKHGEGVLDSATEAAPFEAAAHIARLTSALEGTHRLISEFALSGFTDHELGLQLYRNQGRLHATLEALRPSTEGDK